MEVSALAKGLLNIYTIINTFSICVLIPLRRYRINFDVGLLDINWLYINPTIDIPSKYVRDYITKNPTLLALQGRQLTIELERRSKRNLKLFNSIARIGADN
ncbi:hypothetical protein SBF1_5000002 [Candidatus Desulfosporosinus infrequens]|uniref:Uncharacterized protein n=1 Tax=Candidatus Desulfosporosinus infrequens TaxID=2043169 RepID=A0A2U3LHJ7_9FIRM|nr:hypothetical protein SBF1_5000002 [Candidatus Desulfosporosinus infrequens]